MQKPWSKKAIVICIAIILISAVGVHGIENLSGKNDFQSSNGISTEFDTPVLFNEEKTIRTISQNQDISSHKNFGNEGSKTQQILLTFELNKKTMQRCNCQENLIGNTRISHFQNIRSDRGLVFLNVTVVDRIGAPLEDAWVQCCFFNQSYQYWSYYWNWTNSNGTVVFEVKDNQTYIIVINSDNLFLISDNISVSGQHIVNILLDGRDTLPLTIHAVDVNGDPLSDGPVVPYPDNMFCTCWWGTGLNNTGDAILYLTKNKIWNVIINDPLYHLFQIHFDMSSPQTAAFESTENQLAKWNLTFTHPTMYADEIGRGLWPSSMFSPSTGCVHEQTLPNESMYVRMTPDVYYREYSIRILNERTWRYDWFPCDNVTNFQADTTINEVFGGPLNFTVRASSHEYQGNIWVFGSTTLKDFYQKEVIFVETWEPLPIWRVELRYQNGTILAQEEEELYAGGWFGFSLPFGSPNGTYTIISTLDTGPYQGNLTATCTVQVGETPLPPPGPDNFADLGNTEDEIFHNLQGWGNAQGPPQNPYTSPLGDQTKRYQLLRLSNSIDLYVDQINVPYLLITEVEDGDCTDNFEIYVNDQGPLYQYTGTNAGTERIEIKQHTIFIPRTYITDTTVKITKDTSTDDCGLAAVYNAQLITTESNPWAEVIASAGTYLCEDLSSQHPYNEIPIDFTFTRNLQQGDTGEDVRYLQLLLNANPATQVALVGAGSPRQETSSFGPKTRDALLRFQTLYNLVATGMVDEQTKEKLNNVLELLKYAPLKHLPQQWIITLITDNGQPIETSPDGIRWFYKVEDVTDKTQGWVERGDLIITAEGEKTKLLLPQNNTENTPGFLFDKTNLQYDAENQDVKFLQYLLKHEGFFPADVFPTGHFWLVTENAVREFQQYYGGLDGATGDVGDETVEKLNEILNNSCLVNRSRASVILDTINTLYPDLVPSEVPLELVLAMTAQEIGPSFDNEYVKGDPDDCGRGILQITTSAYIGLGSTIRCYSQGCQGCGCEDDRNQCKCYYTNTFKGLESNILDGLRILHDSYVDQCSFNTLDCDCQPPGQMVDIRVDSNDDGKIDEHDTLVFNVTCGSYIGSDGKPYNSKVNFIRDQFEGSDIIVTASEFKVLDAIWRYNGRITELHPNDTHYLLHVGEKLGTLSQYFGTTYRSSLDPSFVLTSTQITEWVTKMRWADGIRKKLIILKSSIELQIFDSQGQMCGMLNGERNEGIPFSVYDEVSETAAVYFSYDSYIYTIKGLNNGSYGLTIKSMKSGNVTNFTAVGIPTFSNATHQYMINWSVLSGGGEGVTIQIDNDGDHVFEQNVTTDNTFQYPNASFVYYPENPIVIQTVVFDASLSFDGDGNITSYRWEFGNGNVSYGKIVTHEYCQHGLYNVILIVTDDDGVSDNCQKQIRVDAVPCVHDEYPPNEFIGVDRPPVTLNASVEDPDGNVLDVYIRWMNHTGVWTTLQIYPQVGNGTYHFIPPSSNDWIWGNTTYTWSVNVTDGVAWTNETYQYTTKGSRYDVNNDDNVNFQDAGLVWVHRTSEVTYDGIYDVNQDGQVNFQDAGLTWINRD